MHHALQIQEITSNILGYCERKNLASLARSCRAFKEPALDVLWETLPNLSPLARCLPEAFHRLSEYKYSLSRSLVHTDWNVLRSYTHRIRFISNFNIGLDQKSLSILSNPPTAKPLFPNLRYMCCVHETQAVHLLRLPLPSLISLELNSDRPHWFQAYLERVCESSPGIRSLSLFGGHPRTSFNKSASNCICLWRNLETVHCPQVALNVDALVHLSRVPALTTLEVMLSAALPHFDSILSFLSLDSLTLYSELLQSISQFLSQTRLPALARFDTTVDGCPSRQELYTFFASLQTSSASRVLEFFSLNQSSSPRSSVDRSEALLLGLESLQPCMAFTKLYHVEVDIKSNVGLKDKELVTLASAWPHLKHFSINRRFGWNRLGGITPSGLRQFLEKCPLLERIVLAIDTRGYTELASSGLLTNLTSPPVLFLNVIDSIIEAESVPALTTFFARTPCSRVSIIFQHGGDIVLPLGWEAHANRWNDVHTLTNSFDLHA